MIAIYIAIAVAMILVYYARILYERAVMLAAQRDGALAEATKWRQRANVLQMDCARKDGIMQNYLREAEQLQVNLAEIERYNESLERQIAILWQGQPTNDVAAILLRRRVEPERN